MSSRELGCEYLPFSDWDRRQFSEFALLACSVVIAPLIEIPFAPVSFGDPLKGLEWFHLSAPYLAEI